MLAPQAIGDPLQGLGLSSIQPVFMGGRPDKAHVGTPPSRARLSLRGWLQRVVEV